MLETKLPVVLTEGQVKKHVSQMNREERYYLRKRLFRIANRLDNNNLHLKNRVDVGSITLDTYKELIKSGDFQVIEYNETERLGKVDCRVVIRANNTEKINYHLGKVKEVYGPCQLCVVISIKTGKIITAYYNGLNDNHYSLDGSRYNASLQIIKEG